MVERSDTLTVQYGEAIDGLSFARQSPPASAVSFAATYAAPAGHAYDPPGREGLAFFVSELLTSGAGRLNRIAFAQAIDRLGGTLTTRCDPETTEITVWGPEAARERLLNLWTLAFRSPRFDSKDVERVRRQLFERQLRESTQPGSRAERELFRAVFPKGHPYRETGVGTRKSVERLTVRDLQRFHTGHFTREGALAVLTCRLPLAAARGGVARRLHNFARSGAPTPPPTPSVRSVLRGDRRVVMRGRSQVEIRMGGPSVARGAAEYSAAFLANEILGGRPLLARLFQNVRERHGLAYDASSELEAMRWGGVWQVRVGTGPDRTSRTIDLVRKEVDRIRTERVSASELDRIRESAIGEIPLQLETTSGAHQLAVDVVYHQLPGDFYSQWPDLLRSLSPIDVRRGAEIAFDPTRTVTVIAGPPSDDRG